MASFAKLAAPYPLRSAGRQPILERVFSQKGTLFSAPPGYFQPAALAGILNRQGMPALWYNITAEDRDPATLLLGLASGAELLFPQYSASLRANLRRRPGEVYGWNSHFVSLAHHLAECAVHHPFTLVLQHIDTLGTNPALLELLWAALFPLLPDSCRVVCTSHTSAPAAQFRLPEAAQAFHAASLALEAPTARRLADDAEIDLPEAALLRLLAWSKGRAGAFNGFIDLCRRIGPTTALHLLSRCRSFQERVAQSALFETDDALLHTPQGVALALRLEYLPPALLRLLDASSPAVHSPFLQTLSGGWLRLHCLWRENLRPTVLDTSPRMQTMLGQAARVLAEEGQPVTAVALWQSLGQYHTAADALEKQADFLLDSGQWQTLSSLLAALPAGQRSTRPVLCAVEGELAAARGQTGRGRALLMHAAKQYQRQQLPEPASRALLAASQLAAWDQKPGPARDLAGLALEMAEQAHQPAAQSWARWQLGALAAQSGEPQEAAAQVSAAARTALRSSAPNLIQFFSEAAAIAHQIKQLRQEKEALLRAVQQVEQAQQEAFAHLKDLLTTPPLAIAELLEQIGWSRMPLFFKLPGAPTPRPFPIQGWAAALFHGIQPRSADRAQPSAPSGHPAPEFTESPAEKPSPVSSRGLPVGFVPALIPWTALPAAPPRQDSPLSPPAIHGAPPGQAAPDLCAYLLGGFRILLHNAPLQNWPGVRSRALFTYLLVNHGQSVSRDTLMETFWPDASPDSARNSLNVAMYGLRQALKQGAEQPGGGGLPVSPGLPVIRSQENGYQINPELHVWIDFLVFKRTLAEGFQSEAQGETDAAVNAYSAALDLYRGDFLTDFLYVDWAALERERLRVLYLDGLEHLSLIEFNRGQLEASIHHCQAILAYDACREDAHCRLMRCYSRLGQGPLALRQYQWCVEALHRELDVPPAPATSQLYEQIRRREAV
jgi:DNA-binding SARP family transcriptional activator